jgi:hypothetical protein
MRGTQRRTGLIGLVASLTILFGLCDKADAQHCKSAPECRATAKDGGALLFNGRVWTMACGPNTVAAHTDKICQEISSCVAAGGFGKFLQAVTSGCQEKHFDGYFGLDGMTFGILEWTSAHLPEVLEAYQSRNKAGFDELLAKLGMHATNGCVSNDEVCDRNKQGRLMCDADFHSSFESALKSSEFQKAELDLALKDYETRIDQFGSLGLRTGYGKVVIAVLANNLKADGACRPETWKRICGDKPDENETIKCMIDQYQKNACRGSPEGTDRRVSTIRAALPESLLIDNMHPSVDAVIACSSAWGRE